MSLPRIITKRIIKELTENLPELIADFVVDLSDKLEADRIKLNLNNPNGVSVIFFNADDEEVLKLEITTKDKELWEKVVDSLKG